MFDGIKNWLYEQYSGTDHDHWYTQIDGSERFDKVGINSDNLAYSQNHPILSGAMLFVCNLFAQGEFRIENLDGTLYTGSHNSLIGLLNKPNYYQTRIDFLESAQWMKLARGKVAIYMKRGSGAIEPDALYILDPKRIKYPDNFKTPMIFQRANKTVGAQTVMYMETDDPKDWVPIKVRDLLWLYDMPNVTTPKNRFITGSRLDGLHQTLDNTVDSLVAKNIILRSNGKEMLTTDGDKGFPMDGDDEEEAKRIFNLGYGLTPNRSRAFITQASVRWQSMHIALRDLGLDESTKVDGNIVYTALHIPKDIISLEAKKTTYNNFRESMTSFIQNSMTTIMNDLTLSLGNELLPDNLKLVGSYSHLEVMQYIIKEKYEAVKLQAEALTLLRKAGVPDKLALEMCGMPINTPLEDVQQETTGSATAASTPKYLGNGSKEAFEKEIQEIIQQYAN